MSAFLRDLRQSFRGLRGSPGFSIIVVLTLALAIGANAAVFSMVDALLLRPFPIADLDRLVMLWESIPKLEEDRGRLSPADFLDWKEQATAFEEIVASEWWDVSLSGEGEPERLQGTVVSPRFLETLGVETYLGRTLLADAASHGARTVVLSHHLFARRFGADPGVLGKTIRLDGHRYEVVGVAREGFDYPFGSELWVPLWFDAQTAAVRDRHYLHVIGRLRDGVTLPEARSQVEAVARRLEAEHPRTHSGRGMRAVALARAVVDVGTPAFLAVWQATTSFVLLIACVNVATLLLARGADRQREISLQQALGAGRGRIVRRLLSESLLLSLAGAALAVPLAWIGIDLLRSGLPAEVQRFVVGWREIDLDGRLLLFTALVTLAATLIFGLFPALRASRPDLTCALKEGGRGTGTGSGRERGRRLLVTAEVALALMLLVASGLSIRGTLRLATADQGYDPDGVMTFQISLPEREYQEGEKRLQFYRTMLGGVRALGGAVSADAVNVLPSTGDNWIRSIDVEGRTIPNLSERPTAHFRVVGEAYFETMRIPLAEGRGLGSGDRTGSLPVAVVSRMFAERYWPGESPLGKRFRAGSDEEPWLAVVGVVEDVQHDWFLGGAQPTVYVPLEQQPLLRMALVVRTAGEPEAISRAVREQILRADPDLPVFALKSMRQHISERILGLKYAASVMGVLGFIALSLSAVGIFGLMAYSVSRRTQEIGVRIALGAARKDVLRLALGQAFAITAIGVAVGLLLAYGAGQLMASHLFGVVQLEATTFAGLALVLGSVSLLAAYLPARRALAVDPAAALRAE